MKTLLLLRHGKSSWKDTELSDHDRPLKKRGRRAAEDMGRLLRDQNLVPDHILTSTACRAIETALLAADAAKFSGEIESCPALYHAESSTFVAVVSRVPDRFERVLLVGHNPGLTDWLSRLTSQTEEFPTAALAHVELPISSWLELSLETPGTLKNLWRPRQHGM